MTDAYELDRLAEELTLRREVTEDGIICYRNAQNQFHRVYGPAIIWPDGDERWCQNGKSHRLDGPAVIFPRGRKCWYIDGTAYTEEQFNAHLLVVQHKANKCAIM